MTYTLVYRRDEVAKLVDDASKALIKNQFASALTDLAEARDHIEKAIAETIDASRELDDDNYPLNPDVTWATIGYILGMTKQGAQQRYGK